MKNPSTRSRPISTDLTPCWRIAPTSSGWCAARCFRRRRNRRLFAVSDVIRAFRALVAKFKGEATADVTVAETLSDKNLDALKTALKSVTGKDVALNVKIDPSITGGLVVKLGSRMVATSLRPKLNSLQHAMKEAG